MSEVFQRIKSSQYRFLLTAIKGLRNGAIYGAKIRFPHALVMTVVFGQGNLIQKIRTILMLTYTHSKNLALFAMLHKLLLGAIRVARGKKQQIQTVSSAFLAGLFVFGTFNPVNMQINLYLLSRVMAAIARMARVNGYIPFISSSVNVFPWFAGAVWGLVLWLHEFHRDSLQGSLQKSMDYIYNESEEFETFEDWILVSKKHCEEKEDVPAEPIQDELPVSEEIVESNCTVELEVSEKIHGDDP